MTSKIPLPIIVCFIPFFFWWLIEDLTVNRWNARPPRVKTRKRRLTLPQDDEECGENLGRRARLRKLLEKPRVEYQSGSVFFRLPIEIRQAVYEEYIGAEKIWILLLSNGKLRGFRDLDNYIEEPDKKERVDLLSLLLTCRKTYSELIELVYTDPTYTFFDPLSFFTFSALLIPRRFQSIKKVHIDCLSPHPTAHIPKERYGRLNEMFWESYKSVRKSSIHGFHNALPREKWSKERDKMLWHKMMEILKTMKGLERLQAGVSVHRFGVFEPTMTWSDGARKRKERLRELLGVGIDRNAEIDLHVANSVGGRPHRTLEWKLMPKGKWSVCDEIHRADIPYETHLNGGIRVDEELEGWFKELAAFKVLIEFNN